MMEVIVFALVLVLAQMVAGIGLTMLMLSSWFTKRVMKRTMEITKETVEMMEKESWL